jgi:hypothetical protein
LNSFWDRMKLIKDCFKVSKSSVVRTRDAFEATENYLSMSDSLFSPRKKPLKPLKSKVECPEFQCLSLQ